MMTSSQNTAAAQLVHDKQLQANAGKKNKIKKCRFEQVEILIFCQGRNFSRRPFSPGSSRARSARSPRAPFFFSFILSPRLSHQIEQRRRSARSPASCYLLLRQPRLNLGCSRLSISTLASFSSSHRSSASSSSSSWYGTSCKSTSLKRK